MWAGQHLEGFVALPVLQQVQQMFRLELQPQLIRDSVELGPLSTQSKLLPNKRVTRKKDSFIFWDVLM